MYKIIKVGIGALILGWWLAHPAWAANPESSTIIGQTIVEIIGNIIYLGKQLRPANDNTASANNFYLGYAQAPTGTDVPGGFGTCVKVTASPQLSACLQQLSGLSNNECALRSAVASGAIRGTPIVAQHTVNPLSGIDFPSPIGAIGGLCYQPTGGGRFTGWFQGKFFFELANHLPVYMCDWLKNQCTGPCSC